MKDRVTGRWTGLVIAVTVLMGGCRPKADPRLDDPRGWIAQKMAQETCFGGSLDTCPERTRRQAVLLDEVLKDDFDGVLPTHERQATRVFRRVRAAWRTWLMSDQGLRETEARLAERYAHPVVRDDAAGMPIFDHGIVPGKLAVGGRARAPRMVGSALLDGSQIKSVEVGRLLVSARRARADARRIEVVATVYYGSARKKWRYRLDVSAERLTVRSGGTRWYAGAVPGGDPGPIAAGQLSVLTRDLEVCSRKGGGDGEPLCR